MTNVENLKSSTALTRQRYMPQRPEPKLSPLKPDEVPTTYDPQWRTYTNLSRPQIDAFMSMSETLKQVARDLRHGRVVSGMPKLDPSMTLAAVIAGLDTAKTAATVAYATETTVVGEIGKTIKHQSDVIAAFK